MGTPFVRILGQSVRSRGLVATRSELSLGLGRGGARVGEDRTGRGESIDLYARRRAYQLVRAALSDDNDQEQGISAARSVAAAVLAEAGIDGATEVAVDLSMRLAAALERIAADQGLAAVDLAEVWFVD